MRTQYAYICQNPECNTEFQSHYKTRRFCTRRCSVTENNRGVARSEEQKQKTSESLKKYWAENPDKIRRGEAMSSTVGASTKGKHRKDPPTSILDLPKRTVSKLLKRLKLGGCSNCGWNLCPCDVHHIQGKKIPNANAHQNLAYLCPNCHRQAHNGLIKKFVTLADQLNDNWLELYYG